MIHVYELETLNPLIVINFVINTKINAVSFFY